MKTQGICSFLSTRALLALFAVSLTATASAQIIAGPNLPPGTITDATGVSQDPFTPAETAWIFGSPQSPIVVSTSPIAGVWRKQLRGAGQFDTSQEVNLVEYIQVGFGPSFTDWHERVITPDFIWGFDPDDTFYTINGGPQQFAGISYSPDFTSVNFVFPTGEPTGTVILLHKELQYMGLPTFDNDVTPILVDQFPTVPEPSCLALLGLGAAGALISRRRK